MDIYVFQEQFQNRASAFTCSQCELSQVVFEAILERGYQGDLAIDDVRVFEGSCVEVSTKDDAASVNGTLALNSTESFNATFLGN